MVPITGAAQPLHVEIVPDRERVLVRVIGEIDLSTVPQLEHALRELVGSGFTRIVVDLEQLEFIDSQGMRCLIVFARELGDGLAILPGPPAVQRAFDIAGLLGVLPFQERGR